MPFEFADIKFSMFFDREGVKRKVKDGTNSVLAKAGAFVRQRAKSSIRSRKKSSRPGQPPSSHTGTLKNLIYFGFDEDNNSVVIGPKLFRKANPTVPHLLEFGGTTRSWRDGRPVSYHAFPFMRPAMEAETDNFYNMFDGAVRGG